MEPLKVSRDNFPMSTATAAGMIPMQPKVDNYEIYYYKDVKYLERNGRQLYLQIIGPVGAKEANLFIMGDSSGAHTAMMAAFSYGIPTLEEDGRRSSTPIVQGVIDLYGPTNFATMNQEPSSQDHRTPDRPEGCEIGGKPVLEHPELVKPATIATYVQEERELPPILMFHGTNDELVPFGQGCELFQAGAKI